MASVLMELNQQRPHPQTNDDPSQNDHKNNAARITCNHFSIRGYVAEVRKKDPILCDPFSRLRADDGSDSMECALPPMVVPKFRWWKCGSCVSNLPDTTPTETTKPPDNKFMPAADNEASPQPSKQLTVTEPNGEAPGEHNADVVASTSYDSNRAPNCPPLVADHPDPKGKGKGKARVENQLMELPTGCEENGTVEPCQKNSALDGIQKFASEGCMDGENGKAGSVSVLPDLNDGDKNAILEPGDVNVCEEEDDHLGVGRRKARKVRLLSELLGTKDAQADNMKLPRMKKTISARSEASDSESEDDKSTEMMMSGDSVRKRGIKSTAGEKSLAEKRSNKKIKTSEQGACNTTKITPKSTHSEASEHKSADDKSTETMMSEDLVKKHVNRSTPDEKSLLEKRRNKKMKTNDQGSCSSTKIPPPKSSKEKPSQEVHSDQLTDLLRKRDGPSELNEKRQGLAKRKGKLVQVAKEKACLKECSAFRKDDKEASSQKATKNVQNEPSNGPIIIDYSAVRKQTVNSCIRDSSVGFTAQNCQAEVGKSPLAAQHNAIQVSGSIMNQKEPMRRVQDIDINRIPVDDKGPEEGKGDDSHDIPMDIVELMAKNQYERNLGDQRDKHQCVVSVPENVTSDGSASTCGHQLPKLTTPHFLSWQSPFSKDPRSNLTNGFEAAMNSPFSKFNQSHLSFTGHNNISRTPVTDKPYYSAFDFSAKNWTGHKEAPQRCAPSFLPTTGPYRPHIEARGWPSGVAKGHHHHHHQGPSVLNFSAVSHLEKQINFSSNTFASASSQKRGAGSSDLYSNEAIPAMHLLSLMQNAGNSDQLKKPPVVPTVCSFASLPFQSDGGINSIGRKPGFPTQIPLTSHGQRNIGSPHFASFRPQMLPVSPSNIGRKRQLDSGLYKGQKGKFGMPNPPHSYIPLQGSRNNVGSCPQRFDKKTIRPIPQEGVCVLNQNPSEFNDLKELRKYMIKPEDLRPRERRVRQGNAKRQEMRMDKHVGCAIRKLTTQVSPM